MRILRVLLMAAGVMCLCGLAGVFLPSSAFVKLASRYGAVHVADQPFFSYVLRLASAVVASCGVFFVVISKDPIRHGALVPAGGASLVFVGAVLAATGASTSMPVPVYLIDSVGCALLGAMILGAWWEWGRKPQ